MCGRKRDASAGDEECEGMKGVKGVWLGERWIGGVKGVMLGERWIGWE